MEGKEWSEIPGIKGSRSAYKAFGRNPGRYRVSSEALIRRVRRGDELYHINSVVDVNNLISVKSGLSVGSYDLGQIHGAIKLRKAEHGEGYTGIGKDFPDMENMLEFSLEDMDMSRFQQGATYAQIQAWVQEKYGFHVTHLNIAQVKRKYGIIERENYNKPKSPDSRQPGCPEEKVKTIENALKHFQMISEK